jgi:hypothetical protein
VAELSPAALAVLDATDYPEDWATRIRVAAALRAAVAQTQQRQYGDCWICDANELRAIAAELDGTNPTSEGD